MTWADLMDEASTELVRIVRGALIQQGSSLAKWCAENGIKRQWATAVLSGRRDGPAARALRSKLVDAVQPGRAA